MRIILTALEAVDKMIAKAGERGERRVPPGIPRISAAASGRVTPGNRPLFPARYAAAIAAAGSGGAGLRPPGEIAVEPGKIARGRRRGAASCVEYVKESRGNIRLRERRDVFPNTLPRSVIFTPTRHHEIVNAVPDFRDIHFHDSALPPA